MREINEANQKLWSYCFSEAAAFPEKMQAKNEIKKPDTYEETSISELRVVYVVATARLFWKSHFHIFWFNPGMFFLTCVSITELM